MLKQLNNLMKCVSGGDFCNQIEIIIAYTKTQLCFFVFTDLLLVKKNIFTIQINLKVCL